MPLNNAPLFSLQAKGTFGKEVVYYVKEGQPMSRKYVVPVQPDSQAQLSCRNLFALAMNSYHATTPETKELWNIYSKEVHKAGRSGYNCYLSSCILYLELSGGIIPNQPFLPDAPYVPPTLSSISGNLYGDSAYFGDLGASIDLCLAANNAIIQTILLSNMQVDFSISNIVTDIYYLRGNRGSFNSVDPETTDSINVVNPNNYTGFDFTFYV